MNASTRKWLLETPLTTVWRQRLELALGVVLSGAAVVALSSTMRPDPAKLAALHATPTIASSVPHPTAEATDTPTMYSAVESGDVSAMQRAYRVGMPLDGMLRLAAASGHKGAILWLLARGADIHEQEQTSFSPMLAADAHPEIVALLHARGAEEPSLLNAAIAAAPNAFARALASHPEQVKEPGVLAATARAPWAKVINKRSMIVKLLDAGADPNDTYAGASALGDVVAACGNHVEIKDGCLTLVRQFLDRGARVTGEALGAALSLDDESRPAVLDALLERPIASGVTATALAHASVKTDDLDRIVKLGVDWAWHDGEEDEALPLLAAVRSGDRDYARALIDAGAPVDVHFKEATCALAEAIDGAANDETRARIVELLVERGANVNRRFPDGRTPLFAAAESGNMRVVNFLIARGAHVNERTLDDTALDAAEQHGNISAARILAAHGGQRTRSSMY